MSALKTLKAQVEQMLINYPEARDSDITLMILLWRQYFPSQIFRFQNGTEYVAVNSLYDLPREDNIKRIRAKFQNDEGKYLPTKLEIALKRGIKENEWRSFMGYPQPDPNKYVEKESMEKETQEPTPQERKPNVLGQCPACGGGLFKQREYDVALQKSRDVIHCLKCGKIL